MILLIKTFCSNSLSENRVLLLLKENDEGSRSALITTYLNAQLPQSAFISSPLQIWFESPR